MALGVLLRRVNRLAGGDGVGPLREDDDSEVVDDREEEHLEESPDADSENMDAMLPRSRPVRRLQRVCDFDRRFGRGRDIGPGLFFFMVNSEEQSKSSGFDRTLRVSSFSNREPSSGCVFSTRLASSTMSQMFSIRASLIIVDCSVRVVSDALE